MVTAGRLAPNGREIDMGKFQDLMDRELRIRGLAENTRKCYLEKMRCFVAPSCGRRTSSRRRT
jgi:hypothetical protein